MLFVDFGFWGSYFNILNDFYSIIDIPFFPQWSHKRPNKAKQAKEGLQDKTTKYTGF